MTVGTCTLGSCQDSMVIHPAPLTLGGAFVLNTEMVGIYLLHPDA